MNRDSDEHDAITETRVAQIVAMMESLQFIRGETVERLAKEWGLAEASVRSISAIASKRVRARVMDHDTVSSEVGLALRDALRRGVEDADTKSIVAVAKTWAEISGASAPVRNEHTGKNGGPIETAARVVVLPELNDGIVGDEGEPAGTPTDTTPGALPRK